MTDQAPSARPHAGSSPTDPLPRLTVGGGAMEGGATADDRAALLAELCSLRASLRDCEQQRDGLLQHAPEAVLLLDPQGGRFVEGNRKAEELFGCSREELLSKGPVDFSPRLQPDGRTSTEAARSWIEHSLEGNAPCFEWRHVRLDGRLVDCEVRLSRMPWQGVWLLRASVTDVTERLAAQRALRASEELSRRILEAVPGGVAQVSMKGAIIQANQTAQRLLGLSLDPLSLRYVADYNLETIHEDGSPCPMDQYPVSRCLTTGRPQPPQTIGVRRPDSKVMWGVFSAVPMFCPQSGRQLGALFAFMDISERKQVEDALQAVNDELSTVMTSVSDYLWSGQVDGAGRFYYRYFSPVVQQILGLPPSHFMEGPERWLNVVHPDDRGRIEWLFRQVVEGRLPRVEVEYQALLPDGAQRWVRECISARRLYDGSVRVDGVGSDVTERKRAEELQRRAAVDLERLVELRTAELLAANAELQRQISERIQAERKLSHEQQLLRKLFELQERERQLASYQIHDGVVQDLVGAQLQLMSLTAQLTNLPAERRAVFERVVGLMQAAISKGRLAIDQLRPMVIDEMGVVGAIEYLVCVTPPEVQATVDFSVSGDFRRLPPLLAETVFRIVQAALENVWRHSNARRAHVSLTDQGEGLLLEIIDDGAGFDLSSIPNDSFGVRSIQERSRLLGGDAQFETSPGAGTRISVLLPYAPVLDCA